MYYPKLEKSDIIMIGKKNSSQSFLRQPLNFLWFECQRARTIRVFTYILSLFIHQSKKKTKKAWASLIFFLFCSFFQSSGTGVNEKWIGQIPSHQKETGLKMCGNQAPNHQDCLCWSRLKNKVSEKPVLPFLYKELSSSCIPFCPAMVDDVNFISAPTTETAPYQALGLLHKPGFEKELSWSDTWSKSKNLKSNLKLWSGITNTIQG